ncbi:hypothetical protein MIT9_P1072 [Methylomarinovum caldicuralii]|uniref:Uncharacterized protein n=1 Tax=Methylomarinovum caldicuralii TaxID=438856 RepID=A0AAU9C6D8_9GAMM|nr:hypothetical protein [Methylomarinovum caldicuralii]BCX81494.1 hypothetical protein MIT9_P1072 [Methylomarinovum caldicuralii]
MKSIAYTAITAPLLLLASLPVSAATFSEGGRETTLIHPNCRGESQGLTLVGLAVPAGPQVKVSIGDNDPVIVAFPQENYLISKSRRGPETYPANPLMGTVPSMNDGAVFAMEVIRDEVAPYGSRNSTTDTRYILWRVRAIHKFDHTTGMIKTLDYVPGTDLVTPGIGFELPSFHPDSCLAKLQVVTPVVMRCDPIDPAAGEIATGEPTLRSKNFRHVIERNLATNPLPARCGEGLFVTIEPLDEEVEHMKQMVLDTPIHGSHHHGEDTPTDNGGA